MSVEIGLVAPNLILSNWVQGVPTNIDELKGNIIVVEVFQVNCPGCFLYGLPQAVSLYERFKDKKVKVIGVATAFEDYDKNTLENLKLLVTEGRVIGETYKALKQYGKLLEGNRLYYNIPFPIAHDEIVKMPLSITQQMVDEFIKIYFPDYSSLSYKEKDDLRDRVREYLQNKDFSARTFELYRLRGTPSSIIIDKQGVLRYSFFGSEGYLEGAVSELLRND